MNASETPLESWKEIAAYLQRNAVTVRRWEKEEGLPVHRHSHKSRASVYAYPSEIDAWRVSRKAVAEQAPVRVFWRWPAFAVTLLLCLVMVGNGLRPQVASAQQTKQAARQVWTPGGSADPNESVVSPDGRFLGFTDWNTGDLVMRDLTAGSDRRLTGAGKSGDFAEGSVISPDNRQIAYGWFDNKAHRAELRVLALAGADAAPRTVHRSEENEFLKPFAWTPDGKQLLILRRLPDRTNQLALVSVQDGSVRVLKSLEWRSPLRASLAPDGRYIAYDLPAGDRASARDIFVLAVDGSQETALVSGPAEDFAPVWSPDGSQVLFLSDRTRNTSLWRVPVAGGKTTGPAKLVKETGGILPLGMTRSGSLYYSPDARHNNIYMADLDAGGKARTPVPAADRFLNSNGHAAFSRDGRYLAYYSFRGAQPGSSTVLVVRTLKTGEERDIRVPLQIAWEPAAAPPRWFPDGRSVLVVAHETQRPGLGYYRVDLASGASELLRYAGAGAGYGPVAPDLSPDGKNIFYPGLGDGEDAARQTRLLRFRLDTRTETELLRAPGQVLDTPVISPDGMQLAFVQRDVKSQSSSIEIVPVAGGEPRQVFLSRDADAKLWPRLAWTPDQRSLLFVKAEKDGQLLWKIPVAGGEPEKTGVKMEGSLNSVRVHPDGRRITFSLYENGAAEVWTLENFLPQAAGSK